MTAIRLVAWREYKQYVTTRGFWISLLMFPVFLALGLFLPSILESSQPTRHFVLIDQSGLFEDAIEERFERRYQQQVLRALVVYAQVFATPEAKDNNQIPEMFRDPSNLDVDAFLDQGGTSRAIEKIRPHLIENAPPFSPPRRLLREVPVPAGVDPRASLEDIAAAIAPYLTGQRQISVDGDGEELFAAILIPAEAAGADWSEAVIEYWSTNLGDGDLRDEVRAVMNDILREREYASRGIDTAVIDEVQDLSAQINSFDPRRAEAEDSAIGLQDRLEQFIPFALAYVLWVSLFTVSNLLLTNVVEEKSNKIIEVLLSSVTANELMIGKLIGVLAVGMTTVLVWLSLSITAFAALPTGNSAFGPSLVNLFLTTPLLPAFLFYFIMGYVILGAVFLAVGGMSSSLSDAQTYLGPLTFVQIVPLILLAFIFRDPNGVLASFMSWVPIYTPYIMMMRVSADPPLFDIIGTTVLIILTALFILNAMGRLFRRSILRTGQPPKFMEIFRLLRRGE